MTASVLSDELALRARRIRLLLMDCDGVLTDGRLYFGPDGETLKVFHARDGQGIVDWHNAGGRSGIISGRTSPIVEMRARQLGIEFVYQGRKDKVAAFEEIVAVSGVSPAEIAFIGDDTPDAEVFPLVGLAVGVADAHDVIRRTASLVTRAVGGRGAVREIIDVLIDARKD